MPHVLRGPKRGASQGFRILKKRRCQYETRFAAGATRHLVGISEAYTRSLSRTMSMDKLGPIWPAEEIFLFFQGVILTRHQPRLHKLPICGCFSRSRREACEHLGPSQLLLLLSR